MKGTGQVVKGRVKEAAGALTGNEELRAEGQTDQAIGHVRQTAEQGVRDIKDSTRKVVDRARDAVKKAVK